MASFEKLVHFESNLVYWYNMGTFIIFMWSIGHTSRSKVIWGQLVRWPENVNFDLLAYVGPIINSWGPIIYYPNRCGDQGQMLTCIIHKPRRQATLTVRGLQSIFFNTKLCLTINQIANSVIALPHPQFLNTSWCQKLHRFHKVRPVYFPLSCLYWGCGGPTPPGPILLVGRWCWWFVLRNVVINFMNDDPDACTRCRPFRKTTEIWWNIFGNVNLKIDNYEALDFRTFVIINYTPLPFWKTL